MKGYWQFLIVGAVCLLAALLWAQRPRSYAPAALSATATATAAMQSSKGSRVTVPKPAAKANAAPAGDGEDPLPGSSSSLPVLAVIGFGVLAGGITSALRTR